MQYVDGFVIPISENKVKAYLKMAKLGSQIWMKHGALDYKECVAEDLKSQWGTTFSKVMKLKPDETVIFAYIVFKSRAQRDKINAKVMKEMEAMGEMEIPFDVKRMVYGGFNVLVKI